MKTKEMKSANSINSVVGFIVKATDRIDELGLNIANNIMASDSCEFVKRIQLSENKRVTIETKRLIYLK
jgi:hypothetical protein